MQGGAESMKETHMLHLPTSHSSLPFQVAKVTIFCVSRSYAVLASAADSLVDLLSQGVLAAAERAAAR